jgi:hypothetical protein
VVGEDGEHGDGAEAVQSGQVTLATADRLGHDLPWIRRAADVSADVSADDISADGVMAPSREIRDHL